MSAVQKSIENETKAIKKFHMQCSRAKASEHEMFNAKIFATGKNKREWRICYFVLSKEGSLS